MSRPLFLEFRSSKPFILTVVAVAVFTDTFFYTLIIPILPYELEERAGIGPLDVQKWISILLSTYALTNLITSPIAGLIVDKSKTRRLPLLSGLCAMAVSTMMYTFGRNIAILIVARALQGVSAAVIRVGGLALITDTFGADKSGAALGWQSVGMFAGTVIGPSISGILYHNFGHYAVFVTAYVVLGMDVLLRLFMIERKVAARWNKIEVEEASTNESACLSPGPQERLLEEAVMQGSYMTQCCVDRQEHDTGSTRTGSQKVSGLSLLLNRRLMTALWATFVSAMIMTAVESIIPLYTIRLFSWTSTQTGLLLIALATSILIDPLLGAWTDKYGSKRFSVTGFLAVTIVYLISTTITHNRTKDKVVLYISFICLGFAVGAILTPNMVEISLLVHAEERRNPDLFRTAEVMGQAYAMLSVAYGLGSLVGPALGGALMVTHGWVTLCLSFAAITAFSSAVTLLFAGASNDDSQ